MWYRSISILVSSVTYIQLNANEILHNDWWYYEWSIWQLNRMIVIKLVCVLLTESLNILLWSIHRLYRPHSRVGFLPVKAKFYEVIGEKLVKTWWIFLSISIHLLQKLINLIYKCCTKNVTIVFSLNFHFIIKN